MRFKREQLRQIPMLTKNQIDIISTSIEAAAKPELWHKTSDLIVDNYGGVSGGLIVIDENHETRIALAPSRFLREDGFEMYSSFMRRDDADDAEVFKKIYHSRSNHIASEIEFFGVNEIDQLPYSAFREWQKTEFNITQRYALKLNTEGPWCDTFIFHVNSKKQSLSSSEVKEIDLISNVLSSSLKSYRIMEQLRSRFNAALGVIDKLGISCFLAINDGQIIHKNSTAQELLDVADGIKINVSGHLSTGNSQLDRKIRKFSSDAYLTAKAENASNEVVIPISRPSGKPPYLLVVNPVIDAYGELEIGLRSVLLFVIDPDRSKTVSSAGLSILGNLTAAETEVCRLLVQGLPTEEIMEIRGVAQSTVRQQIKSIFSKLNCKSRIELIRLAIDTRLPIV